MKAEISQSVVYLVVAAFVLVVQDYYYHTTQTKGFFLWMGLLGQVIVLSTAYAIYNSQSMKASIEMYMFLYAVHLVSLSLLDMEFYRDNPKHFTGLIHNENQISTFVDFFYLNASIISTIGFGDITATSTTARLYTVYKILLTVFICAFLLNDIVVKSSIVHPSAKK